MEGLKWYLVKTKPLSEQKVNSRLADAGYETLFPRVLKRNRRTRTTGPQALFPTYLFVRFLLDQLRTVRYTRGVARVVSFGPEPQEVDPEIIQAIRGRMDDSGLVALVKAQPGWKPGDMLRIDDGPFEGFQAVFVEELPDRERVVLLLDAVSSFRLTLPKDSVSQEARHR